MRVVCFSVVLLFGFFSKMAKLLAGNSPSARPLSSLLRDCVDETYFTGFLYHHVVVLFIKARHKAGAVRNDAAHLFVSGRLLPWPRSCSHGRIVATTKGFFPRDPTRGSAPEPHWGYPRPPGGLQPTNCNSWRSNHHSGVMIHRSTPF